MPSNLKSLCYEVLVQCVALSARHLNGPAKMAEVAQDGQHNRHKNQLRTIRRGLGGTQKGQTKRRS